MRAMMDSDAPPGRPKTPSHDRPTNSASTSPSISSLIDPPVKPLAHSHPLARFVSNTTETASTMVPSSPSATIQVAQPLRVTQSKGPTSAAKEVNGARDEHPTRETSVPASKTTKKISPKSSTGNSPAAAPSPKPVRRREPPVPPPSGSGLLSSMFFGGPGSALNQTTTEDRPTIILDITVNCEEDRYIHFPKLVEERYGIGALDTHMAAQRDRMARITAAGAALEKQLGAGSPGDMSLDLTESDSNVETGGAENSGDGGDKKKQPPKKKRRAKGDEYDKEDPFVDDSEMIWIEQAASSKDGFFVYQGPLIPAGEKPNIERADGKTKRAPRSRRGVTSRANGSSKAAGASGTAAGSKGSGTVRKPRITKADRTRMEKEKQDRERMAVLAAKPSTYKG